MMLHTVLRSIYLNGPGPLFHEGMDVSNVCSKLSGIESFHFEENPLTCDKIITRKVNAWALIFQTILFVHFAVCVLRRLLFVFVDSAFDRLNQKRIMSAPQS